MQNKDLYKPPSVLYNDVTQMYNKNFSSMIKEFPFRISFVFEQVVDTGGFVEIFILHFKVILALFQTLNQIRNFTEVLYNG